MPMLDKALNTVIMPFGLKLRRTGRYILSHKNSFLIRVQLLDNTVMEWNVTVENTGNDCLNAVAQKLELRETKYFGLHYVNKQMKIRWVELDKPLKKQFDKHAHGPNLYFGIMYYVANIDSLMQEITRYLFYLQLKNNVIDGMLKCNKGEAIELASYMLQAEFGDHDPHEHVVGYFRDYILFPEVLTPDEAHLDSLTVQAIDYHKRHRGLSPSDAEYNYILKAIHLSGFSEDIYPAKNNFGNDVIVGCSFAGVVIKSQYPDQPSMKSVCHEWQTVEHLSHSKLTLSIEILREDTSVSLFQFCMEDADTAKYLCRMCESLKKFHLQNKETTRQLPLESASTLIRRPTLRRNLEVENEDIAQPMASTQPGPADFVSSQDNLEMYGTDTRYYSSQNSLDRDAYVSQNSLNHLPQQDARYSNGFGGSVYSSTSINSLALSHVGRPSPANSNLSINSSQQRGMNRAGLPMYRSSPDYDVAMRGRRRYSSYLESNNANVMHQSSNQQHPSNVPQPNLKPRPHSMIYSQQELVHQATHGPYYAHYPQHPPLLYRRSQPPLDSSQGQVLGHIQWDRSHESLSPPGGSQVVDLRLTIPLEGRELPSMTGSTPELTIQQQGRPFFVSEIQLHRHFQSSQPAQQGAGSTSTPDLSQHRQAVSASSPDLHFVNNQPPRPHRPLPPVESYGEDKFNEQQMANRVMGNHMQASRDGVIMRKEHPQGRPASTSYDRSVQQHKQTPEQNVQAYLEQVNYGHHSQSKDATAYNQPYSRQLAGSREHLIKQESFDQQQYGSQQRIPTLTDSIGSGEQFRQYSDSHLALQQQSNVHHATEPSTATMVVYSSGSESEATSDYILSQQLQDKAIQQARHNRSLEYLGPDNGNQHKEANQLVGSLQQININKYLRGTDSAGPSSSNYRPPPPYPDNFVAVQQQPQPVLPRQEPEIQRHVLPEMTQHHEPQIPQEETSLQRGPPPPYHTPSPSVAVQDPDPQQPEEEELIEASGDSFQHARRSMVRKMNPLKFAAMNGLSVSQRPTTPVKGEPDERALNLQAKVEEGHVLTEYDQIPRTRLDEHEVESLASRDRVKEVVPYRDCRVEITPSSDNPLGYINASHVKAIVAGKQWRYISCQTPMEGLQHELWDTVWLNNVSIIVLITKEMEHGKSRCARYWPSSDDNQDIPSAVFGDYRVMCRFDSCHPTGVHDSIVTRNLVLERVGESEKRTVWMLQYIGWPDTGVPKGTDGFLAFLEELQSVRRLAEEHTDSDSVPPPVVVQCASGSGRSGVLILAELMVQCLEHNQDTTVPEMLTHIRQQRMHFVQTFTQYNFVYKILISFLRKSRLI